MRNKYRMIPAIVCIAIGMSACSHLRSINAAPSVEAETTQEEHISVDLETPDYNEKRHTAISNGKKFQEKPPVLNMDTNVFPSMYKNQMYSMDGSAEKIKLFIRNTWDWVEVVIPNRDMKDLAAKSSRGKLLSPSLQYRFHKYYLSFPIEYPFRKFPKVDLCDQKIMGVDLGIRHDR